MLLAPLLAVTAKLATAALRLGFNLKIANFNLPVAGGSLGAGRDEDSAMGVVTEGEAVEVGVRVVGTIGTGDPVREVGLSIFVGEAEDG